MEPKYMHLVVVATLLLIGYFILRPSKREKRSQALIDCANDYEELKRRIITADPKDFDKIQESVFDYEEYYKSRASSLYIGYAAELHELIAKRSVKALKDFS